jgi:hypothetical protein
VSVLPLPSFLDVSDHFEVMNASIRLSYKRKRIHLAHLSPWFSIVGEIRQYAETSSSSDNGLGKPVLSSSSPQKATESLVEDDGYAATLWGSSRLGRMRRWLRTIRVGKRGLAFRRALPQALKKTPGTLILVRHGESAWNQNKTFTGWCDPGLSTRGEREVEHAARLLLEGGYEIDVCYTSRLQVRDGHMSSEQNK